jgi:hypothetical protein
MSSPMGAAIPGGALWGGSGSGAPSRDLIERLYGDAPDQVLFQSPGKGTSCKYYESPNAGNSITGIAPESVQTGSYIDTYDAMNGVAAHTQLTNTIISPMIYASDVNSPNGVNFLRVEWLNSLMQLSGDSGVTWTPFDFTTWLANHPLPGPYAVYTEIFGNTPRPSQMMFGSDGNFYVGLALYKWGSYFNQQKIGMFGFLKIPSGFFENPNNPNEQPSFIMVSEFGGSTAGGPQLLDELYFDRPLPFMHT